MICLSLIKQPPVTDDRQEVHSSVLMVLSAPGASKHFFSNEPDVHPVLLPCYLRIKGLSNHWQCCLFVEHYATVLVYKRTLTPQMFCYGRGFFSQCLLCCCATACVTVSKEYSLDWLQSILRKFQYKILIIYHVSYVLVNSVCLWLVDHCRLSISEISKWWKWRSC